MHVVIYHRPTIAQRTDAALGPAPGPDRMVAQMSDAGRYGTAVRIRRYATAQLQRLKCTKESDFGNPPGLLSIGGASDGGINRGSPTTTARLDVIAKHCFTNTTGGTGEPPATNST